MSMCLVCGNNEMDEMPYKYSYRTDAFNSFFPDIKVMYCSKCKLFQTNIESKNENEYKLSRYYKKEYRGGVCVPPKLQDKKSKYYIRGKEIADIVERNYKGDKMSVFEKGCGWGINLLCIKERFPKAEIYTDEPDEHTTEMLRNVGIEYTTQDKKFDVIIMSHVLEHLLNPIGEIKWVYEHLASKGFIYIEVPNSLNFAEPHVTFWTKDALLRFFHSIFNDEFEVLECYTTGYTYYTMKDEPYKINYKNWGIIQKIVPAVKMQNRKMKNGVYLKVLLRKRK